LTQEKTIAAIATDFKKLGIEFGDTLLVHSSFKALGPVPGGIETLVKALIHMLGPTGTLLTPALSYMQEPNDIHHAVDTPSCVGAIPEYVRLREGTQRSLHPTHSVCGIGHSVDALLAEHSLDSTPCGPHSPFRKLLEGGGKIAMLGCGLRPSTIMHCIEEFAIPPYLFGEERLYYITDAVGKTFEKTYRTHGFDGWAQRYDRVADLPDTSFMRRGQVLKAETCVLDAPGLKTAVLAKLREDPLFFVERTSQN